MAISSGTDGNDARIRAEQGFEMVSITTDVGVLSEGMISAMETAKGGAGEKKTREGY
jgi:4-hydroxy-2-oxoheptanedioate aldolase